MLLPVVMEDSPRKAATPCEDASESEPLSEQAVAEGSPQLQHAASSTFEMKHSCQESSPRRSLPRYEFVVYKSHGQARQWSQEQYKRASETLTSFEVL